jgi:hypothetical protein
MTVRIALAIDVEPDPRLLAGPQDSDWDGFRASLRLLGRLRDDLARTQRTPVSFTWLLRMDPQIRRVYGDGGWIASRFAAELDALEREGDDVGLHTHLYRWDEREAQWLTDYHSTDWMQLCVEEAVRAYHATRSRAAKFHSFGDRYFSEAAVGVLEKAGLAVDMTVEPGLVSVDRIFPSETLLGSLPDMSRAPRSMWRPAHDDYLRDDPHAGRNILLLPLTTYRFPTWMEPGRWVSHAVRRMHGNEPGLDEWLQHYARIGCTQRGYVFRHSVRAAMAADRLDSMHFVLRANQTADPAARERIVSNLAWLARGGLGTDVEFVSTTALLATAHGPAGIDRKHGPGKDHETFVIR